MGQVTATAWLTVKLLMRGGVVPGMLAMVAGVALFLFSASSGDGTLVGELQVRVLYSYAMTYALLTLSVLATACFVVRSQIDGKQIHLLTSRPIDRGAIWLGQWLGVTAVAALGNGVLIGVIAAAAAAHARNYPEPERQAGWEQLGTVRYEHHPVQEPIETLTRRRVERLVEQDILRWEEVDSEVWEKNRQAVRREERLVQPGTPKNWEFDLGGGTIEGEYVEFRCKFYNEDFYDRSSRVRGRWELTDLDGVLHASTEFEVEPFSRNAFRLPKQFLPASGRFRMTLTLSSDREVVVKRNGLKAYREYGTVWGNLVKAFVLQGVHLAVAAGAGLAVGVAFTFPVASFLALVLYLLSVSAGFFTGVMRELSYGVQVSALDRLAAMTIRFGVWLAKGLQPPGIGEALSTGLAVPLGELSAAWLPSLLAYGAVVLAGGVVLLRQKELDKILT